MSTELWSSSLESMKYISEIIQKFSWKIDWTSWCQVNNEYEKSEVYPPAAISIRKFNDLWSMVSHWFIYICFCCVGRIFCTPSFGNVLNNFSRNCLLLDRQLQFDCFWAWSLCICFVLNEETKKEKRNYVQTVDSFVMLFITTNSLKKTHRSKIS